MVIDELVHLCMVFSLKRLLISSVLLDGGALRFFFFPAVVACMLLSPS